MNFSLHFVAGSSKAELPMQWLREQRARGSEAVGEAIALRRSHHAQPIPTQSIMVQQHHHHRGDDASVPMQSAALETAVERTLAAFLEPFALSDLGESVHKLLGAGYTSPNALRALDEDALKKIKLHGRDGDKIMLAAWLYSVGLIQHGSDLVAVGIDSLFGLVCASDEKLKAGGVRTMGHRRQLQRYLREDEQVQAMVARAREAQEAERDPGRRQLRGIYAARTGSGTTTSIGMGGLSPLEQHNAVVAQRLLSLPGASSGTLNGLVGVVTPREAWHSPWRTMSHASLSTGSGEVKDSHPEVLGQHTFIIGGMRMW